MNTSLWEILVPTIRNDGRPIKTRFHRVWDEKVRAISGGLTIMPPSKGQWKSPEGSLFVERMIPVRIVATEKQIDQIIDMTLAYYEQLAVLAYKLSDVVKLKYADSGAKTEASTLMYNTAVDVSSESICNMFNHFNPDVLDKVKSRLSEGFRVALLYGRAYFYKEHWLHGTYVTNIDYAGTATMDRVENGHPLAKLLKGYTIVPNSTNTAGSASLS